MSQSALKSLTDIMANRVYRIPDYQRGYAWEQSHLEDLWEDLENLPTVVGSNGEPRHHYMGLLTLEEVSRQDWREWADDPWPLEDLSFKAFHVVDGQQRLVTLCILLHVIASQVAEGELLASQSADKLRSLILQRRHRGDPAFLLIGYDKADPSDVHLVSEVFGESDSRVKGSDTLYTKNLDHALRFFQERVGALARPALEALTRKVTGRLVFNVFEMDDATDVHVAFETMNNRGKRLSTLELLKNRFIYIATLLRTDEDGEEAARAFERKRAAFRTDINNTWKAIYSYLGMEPTRALDDDTFLNAHAVAYFGTTAARGTRAYLLDDVFSVKRAHSRALDLGGMREYLASLKEAARWWFEMRVPERSSAPGKETAWLDKLERRGYGDFAPLVLAAYLKRGVAKESDLLPLLQLVERTRFLVYDVARHRTDKGRSQWQSLAYELLRGKGTVESTEEALVERLGWWGLKPEQLRAHLTDLFDHDHGWYAWSGLRYFLFEYDLSLGAKKRETARKVSWRDVVSPPRDKVSIEHVLPQTPTDSYWTERFGHLDEGAAERLCHSLGNLVLLAQPKNSSLLNDAFPQKRDGRGGEGAGYRYGSYSENEIAAADEWTPETIRARGLKLLKFLVERWDIELGDSTESLELLGLAFMDDISASTESASE